MPKETKTKLSIATAILVFIATAFGLFTGLDSRVDGKVSKAKNDVEVKVVQSLEKFQQQQDQIIEQQDIRYWSLKIDTLIEQKDRLQEDLMKDPHNPQIKDKIEKLDNKIDEAKKKLDELLGGR